MSYWWTMLSSMKEGNEKLKASDWSWRQHECDWVSNKHCWYVIHICNDLAHEHGAQHAMNHHPYKNTLLPTIIRTLVSSLVSSWTRESEGDRGRERERESTDSLDSSWSRCAISSLVPGLNQITGSRVGEEHAATGRRTDHLYLACFVNRN